MSKLDAAISLLLKRYKESKDPDEKTQLYNGARVLNAAAAVDERDLGRVFMGFVSTEMRALLGAIKESK